MCLSFFIHITILNNILVLVDSPDSDEVFNVCYHVLDLIKQHNFTYKNIPFIDFE